MPKPSRVPDAPQRAATLRGPRHVRTSSFDSDPLHHQSITDQSPRIRTGDRRSPRSTQSDPLNQKKLGTRITDLENQLTQAQHELKSLKQQLSSTEAAKKQVQDELNKKGSKRLTTVTKRVQSREKKPPISAEIRARDLMDKPEDEAPEGIHRETDVFEVQVEKMLVKPKDDLSHCSVDDGKETKVIDSATLEPEKLSLCYDVASELEDIDQLRAKMEEKEKKFQEVNKENETLKQQLEEAESQIASARNREEEMGSKVYQLEQELETSKANTVALEKKILEVEVAKDSLEAEMKKMKVQTEQWRKAADAAAAVLAGGPEMNDRISERCASMDKHSNGVFDQRCHGYGGYLESPETGDDIDDGFVGGKKKGSGIRMLGDLWKKKGHK